MSTPEPTCPRCGYDQSGAVRSWIDRCPLEGTCPECGLVFAWAAVMRPGLARVAGFYEHASSWRNWAWAWRTWWWAARPWVFARRVGLEHPPCLGRLLLWLPVLALPLHALHAALRSIAWALNGSGGAWNWQDHAAFWFTHAGYLGLGFWQNFGTDLFTRDFFVRSIPVLVRAGAAIPAGAVLVLGVLARTRARARVRPGHLLRAIVYGLAWVPALIFLGLVNAAWELVEAWRFTRLSGAARIWAPGFAGPGLLLRYDAPLMLAVVLWSVGWWWAVIVRVYRLPHARRVWAATMLVALLFVCLVILNTDSVLMSGWFVEWMS